MVESIRLKYVRSRNQYRRILRAAERAIRRDWRLFSLTGIPTADSTVVGETIASPRLLHLLPDDRKTRRYWRGNGFRGFLKALHPSSLDDLAIGNILYRPGPLASGIANIFLERKFQEPLHPSIAPMVQPTRGVIVFQEQVVEILKKTAGFSTIQAHTMRRALGRKDLVVLEKWKRLYVRRLQRRGWHGDTICEVSCQIEREGGLAFSRGWACESMGCLYRMAYLQIYFPQELSKATLQIAAVETVR